jgi:predicted cupin superfamily sugar epimerase
LKPASTALHQLAQIADRLISGHGTPEGGWFRETFRDQILRAGTRAASTAIYYLLRAEETSRWHRVDAAEVWHWYAGAALRLTLSAGAEALSDWTLAGCTVAPGFDFAGFELAPAGWEPG